MRGGRWWVIAAASIAVACHGGYPLLPRNVRESVHRDHPDCRGRHIRGVDLGGGRYQVIACGMNVVYACATGDHSRWRACVPEQTAGGYVATGQPVTIMVTGASSAEPPPSYVVEQQPVQPATVAPTREQIEAGIGQWIDSHRAEILACTGTPAALVEVSWDASGIPVIALGGEMRGSAGEPCVARVLSGVQLQVGGQPGAVRHVVQ